MTGSLRALTALFLSAAFLIGGTGLQNTLLSVRGEIESFPLALIGLLMSVYYLGFVAGCRFAPRFIRDVGHVRTFTAFASLASAAALAHALFVEPVFWLSLRFVTGFALAGMYMIIEGWINESVDNTSRGRVLSVYRIIDLTALTIGQALLTVAAPQAFDLFAIASILLSLSLVPMALSTARNPQPISSAKLDIKGVFRVSPVAIMGCLGVGLANSSFWSMAPVFIQRGGYGTDIIAAFISAAIIGGAIMQWPAGLVSDKVDRRIVIVIMAILCAIISMAIGFYPAPGDAEILVLGVLFGLFSIPTYGLAIAHGNDRAEPGEFISLNATLLFVYGLGAIAGPVLGALAMNISRPFLFVYIGSVYSVLAIVTLLRLLIRAKAPEEERAKYAPLPRSTPAVFQMIPERWRK